MDDVVSLLFTSAQVLACAAFVAIGFYVVMKAEGRVPKIAGYVVILVFSAYGLLVLFAAPYSETSSGNSDVQCWNFPNRELAQLFYDTVQESRPGFYQPLFDADKDGIVCEEGVEYRPD